MSLLGVTVLGKTGLQTALWTDLLSLTLLERIDLPELMVHGQTGLLRQTFFEIIGLLERTLLKHTGLLGWIGLLGYTLLE